MIKAGQLVLSLSIIVILHELGHFLFAKLFKTRVEKFYLFFNPGFSLFKFKKGETEYGVGWLPLGGYVKIAGMIDESMDREQLKKPPQPYEFRSKPTWQRLLIMVAGVLVNFITALAIYILLLYHFGREYIPNQNLTYGVVWDSLAIRHGFENGDKIVSVNGYQINDFGELTKYIIEKTPQSITVQRDGELKKVTLPPHFVDSIIAEEAVPIAVPFIPNIVDSVLPGSSAQEKGIQKGDVILAVNGHPTKNFEDIAKIVSEDKTKPMTLKIARGSDTSIIDIGVPKKGLIGFAPVFPKPRKITYTFAESIPAGIKFGIGTLGSYVKQLKHVFTRVGLSKIGGFGTIGNLFPGKWEWDVFWNLTAFLSIILAFMNILPIPALDGGHVLFLLYEIVTGRKPGEKFLEYAQIVGMIILLSLLLYANGNDIYHLVFK